MLDADQMDIGKSQKKMTEDKSAAAGGMELIFPQVLKKEALWKILLTSWSLRMTQILITC